MCKSQLKKVVTKEQRSTSQSKSKISGNVEILLIYSLELLRQQQPKEDHLQLIQSRNLRFSNTAACLWGNWFETYNNYVLCTKGLNSSEAVISRWKNYNLLSMKTEGKIGNTSLWLFKGTL